MGGSRRKKIEGKENYSNQSQRRHTSLEIKRVMKWQVETEDQGQHHTDKVIKKEETAREIMWKEGKGRGDRQQDQKSSMKTGHLN